LDSHRTRILPRAVHRYLVELESGLMKGIEVALLLIGVLLVLILARLGNIERRLKERFPSEKEQDKQWAKADPMGHWEAHRKDK
jgi:hypothetical protein